MEVEAESLARFFGVVLPHMNERQVRVVLGAMAELVGNKTATPSSPPAAATASSRATHHASGSTSIPGG